MYNRSPPPSFEYKAKKTMKNQNKQNPVNRSTVKEAETSYSIFHFRKYKVGITELTLEVRKYLGREMISEKWEIKREGGGVEMKAKREERKWSEIRRMQLRERNQRQRGERDENGFQVIPESKYDLSSTIFYLGKLDLD
ncbi:unnamed protein product [Citrullus colocynthis]|uniref:Uncharacterized protein n=1 Tax=Citrullus colocynthis TaxID=252529 RepID=A0ABP0YEZ5_9ROSI